ncbi:MAG: ribosomal-processing cysteine protease Prp [Clostridia bacterium]|nr:ribosomal-processing cysteine protease Prp [Clostridia bacterium]
MTYVTAKKENGIYRISARGHATGSPECCAAVSALACTLAGYAGRDPEIKVLSKSVAPGRFGFSFSGGERARLIFGAFAFGFCALARAFPLFVSFDGDVDQ